MNANSYGLMDDNGTEILDSAVQDGNVLGIALSTSVRNGFEGISRHRTIVGAPQFDEEHSRLDGRQCGDSFLEPNNHMTKRSQVRCGLETHFASH